MSKVLVLILAGGEGGRLGALTQRRAKPAMPFAGVYRLIDFSLSNCVHSHLSDVWIIEQYEPHSINEHLANGRPWDLDRTYGGLQVLPPHQNPRTSESDGGFAQGNADAIYRNRRFIRQFAPDLVLVLSSDHVYKLDYRKVIAAHEAHGGDVTMVVTDITREKASRFGVVTVGDGNMVTGFQYKPEEPASSTVTTEVFLYNAKALLETLEKAAQEKQSLSDGADDEPLLKDFGHELLPRLVESGKAFAYHHNGYWRDVGTIDSYWDGHMDLLNHPELLELDDPSWPILTYGSQRLPARIMSSASIEDSLVSPGCYIAGKVMRSVLAPGVRVEEGAEVRDSVLLHDVTVAASGSVTHAIVDSAVKITQSKGSGDEIRVLSNNRQN
jgi:glucose-1-phosphate adenylyltransferase